jgi:hypothetical protein
MVASGWSRDFHQIPSLKNRKYSSKPSSDVSLNVSLNLYS